MARELILQLFNLTNKEKRDIIYLKERGAVMKIACPNCGSTAQVRIVWQPNNFYGDENLIKYKCGCGCCFVGYFKLDAIMIMGGNENA